MENDLGVKSKLIRKKLMSEMTKLKATDLEETAAIINQTTNSAATTEPSPISPPPMISPINPEPTTTNDSSAPLGFLPPPLPSQ
jgi:hypothetical protein